MYQEVTLIFIMMGITKGSVNGYFYSLIENFEEI